MERVELGRNLEELRSRRMLTQGALAERAGVSPTTVSGIESGRISRPQGATLRKLARVLGVEAEELYGRGRQSFNGGSNVEEFDRDLEGASTERLKALLGELELERRRLEGIYGELPSHSDHRPHIRVRIQEVAARSASVSLVIRFHRR